jgi:hypothetical protein
MKKSTLLAIATRGALALSVGLLAFTMSADSAGKRDFISYWAAGQQLVHGENPYDRAAILSLEHSAGLEGDRPLMMRNPPFALFLALPLGLVHARTGAVLWLLVLMASLVASVRLL